MSTVMCMTCRTHLQDRSPSCLTAESLHAGEVQKVMEGVARLSVPLKVNVSFGTKWGSMQGL